MDRKDVALSGKVRKGAGDTYYARVGPGGQAQPFYYVLQQSLAIIRERAVFFHLGIAHLRIGIDAFCAEAFRLHLPGRSHPGRHGRAALGFRPVDQAPRIDGIDPNMKIDAVEQGAGQTAEISYTLPYRTGAAVTVAIVAAGAGIGSGHQHEGGRIFHLPAKARNDDLPVFHRPTEGLHHTLGHLRELVQIKRFAQFLFFPIFAVIKEESIYEGGISYKM